MKLEYARLLSMYLLFCLQPLITPSPLLIAITAQFSGVDARPQARAAARRLGVHHPAPSTCITAGFAVQFLWRQLLDLPGLSVVPLCCWDPDAGARFQDAAAAERFRAQKPKNVGWKKPRPTSPSTSRRTERSVDRRRRGRGNNGRVGGRRIQDNSR